MGMTNVTRPGWRYYFLGIAEAVAKRGDCTRSQVGAVLVRVDLTIASTGYNGVLTGEQGCLRGACPRGKKSLSERPPGGSYDDCIALHAENNCLGFARESTAGYTMYVTRAPCRECVKFMRAHRLHEVVWPEGAMYLDRPRTTDRTGMVDKPGIQDLLGKPRP